MSQFLFIFGPASVTYLVAEKCSQKSASSWYHAVIEMICYGALDAIITLILLHPFHKAEIYATSQNVNVIQYGTIAFAFSMLIGVICGLAAAMVKKRVRLRIEIEKTKESDSETKDEGKEA